ncbi:MAG: P1 family peptidase [Mogibacterium sp.]|nr:P1 family peptidase [Mogibacterium sp.]
MAMKKISITDIGDFKLGNAENSEKGTGCTVIICEEGAVGGVDVRGGGPATRETDLLRSENTVNAVNAVVLSGGSAFGLEAASGVMRELAEMKIGFDVGDDIVVPIVCGASLYDLPVGEKAFPDIYMGAQAVRNAFEGSFAKGNHGAGTGATVGKLKGYERAMKSGLGTFACGDGIVEVGAIAAVNAVGDIYNGAGNIIAGLRSEDGESIYGTIKTLKNMVHDKIRQTEESITLVNKADLKEALAAAAKQFEEETQTEKNITKTETAEPETETKPEVTAELVTDPVAEFVFQAPVEEPAEEFKEQEEVLEIPEENIPEELNEDVPEEVSEAEPPVTDQETVRIPEETPEERVFEMSEEDIPEEPCEEVIESSDEEFSPDTPAATSSAENFMEYAEISIPAVTAEQEPPEEIHDESVEESVIEDFSEEDETPVEEFPESEEINEEPQEVFEEPEAEVTEELQGKPVTEAEEEIFTEITAEDETETPEEAFTEPDAFDKQEDVLGDSESEVPEAAVELEEEFVTEELHEEPQEEFVAEELHEEPQEEFVAEEIHEEPQEEFVAEELHEEPVEEVPEFIEEAAVEDEVEEPVVLTREDMGYDIVFNTTISCLITNAALTKSQANKLASILHDAYARAIKPVHGTLDGDTVFVLATGKQQVNFDAFAALATDVLQYAIIDGAMSAEGAYGLPAARDMQK